MSMYTGEMAQLHIYNMFPGRCQHLTKALSRMSTMYAVLGTR